MSELNIVVVLRAKAGKEDELRRDLKVVTDESRKEDGSLNYNLYVDRNDPGRFVFVEHWASQEHRDRHHNESAHIRHFHENGVKNVEATEFAFFLDRVE
ncbi:putative quinol monooxygenase [Rhizobium lusitanum]|uniref:Quinol monooxygenase YgiN n=1 Tax=Rhizobium lusitanum TaxID=293958 RepID=A0A7X0IV04_9HYPH|nr:putative quinol monooxygenase [Rhizobium lusitanum]MBB6487122.1 quinol monooxygenase YgiN [Rhizobium lusitanum]